MGSVRNPIGPLPSSIYWRRRAVVLCLVALLAVLAVWAVNSGGSSGGTGAKGPGGHTPATSITPGPTPSGPHLPGRPGGRDTSGGSGSGGSSDGTSSGGSSGSPSGGTDSGVSGGGSNGASSGGAASGGSSGQLPAGSTLADCAVSDVQLTLRSTQNSYAPGQKPKFELTAANSAATACKLDFGSTAAIVTITNTTGNKHVWSTDDCPAGRGAYLLQVPAHSSTTYTIEWNRQTSSPDCATPKGQQAAVGTTYLVEARLQGFTPKQASFVLKAD
ncbi:hypothetical protein G3I60_32695 [Streptomyces sp. SID13666]|uniref:hypothetical protein n=1 Tax=Streptomyces TaxID=1883 RepID=UPI0011068653|nr:MULTISPECIES: hypothetical protein [Streptomyces]MCZ4101113.1 hypothetical protein [Streptomyces sp. H39-C1]NEA58789.1 hypothetical protein [Streptomyces sp. SID13666]NEA74582.1 hypothetical protein [Streptomyces sp. SID13588]QNA74637.1 hypothetical protein C8250_024515 [Streptomyces sp. So13.3]